MIAPGVTPPADGPATTTEEVLRACLALGFASAGIAPAQPASRPQALRRWLAEGRHGEMDWMAERVEEREDIQRLLLGARSVIMVADQYAAPGEDAEPVRDAASGRIARYARGRDYHKSIQRRLHALCDRLRERLPSDRFRAFVDTGPVLEREHAARAGLGFIGKHTLLIDPAAGSYLLLGGIATTLVLRPTGPAPGTAGPESRCGTCTRCIDACPTGAITPFSVDARRCISYLTIEHEGPIDERFHAAIEDRVFGCDVCQEVCPFNHPRGGGGARARVNSEYAPREGLDGGRIPLVELLGWTAEERRVRLTVSAGKRASLGMMRRNAVIVAGNTIAAGRAGAGAILGPMLERIATDPGDDPVVRDTAAATLVRLGPGHRLGDRASDPRTA